MELKVKSDSIRSERKARAWSQEHLAHVSGVGVRTVQRIESSGVASYESIQAIAAALDLPASELMEHSDLKNNVSIWHIATKRRVAVLISSLLVAIGFLVTNTVVADQVMLDVGVNINEELRSEAVMSINEGENAVIEFGEGYKLLIAPSIENSGNIVLSVQLLKADGDTYETLAKPRIITQDTVTAMIRSGKHDGDTIDITITPTAQ